MEHNTPTVLAPHHQTRVSHRNTHLLPMFSELCVCFYRGVNIGGRLKKKKNRLLLIFQLPASDLEDPANTDQRIHQLSVRKKLAADLRMVPANLVPVEGKPRGVIIHEASAISPNFLSWVQLKMILC